MKTPSNQLMSEKPFNSDGEPYECVKCGIGATHDDMMEFHKDNFGSEHWFIPTTEPVN